MHGRGGMCGRGHTWHGGYVVGVCMAGVVHGRGACVAGETAIAVGGTHPTGMNSRFF